MGLPQEGGLILLPVTQENRLQVTVVGGSGFGARENSGSAPDLPLASVMGGDRLLGHERHGARLARWMALSSHRGLRGEGLKGFTSCR